MSDSIKLHIFVALKHILTDGDSTILNSETGILESDEDDDGKENFVFNSIDDRKTKQSQNCNSLNKRKLSPKTVSISKVSKKTNYKNSQISIYGEDLLDFEGPKLIEGIKYWLYFYQITAQLNWIGKPLYVSMIYKVLVLMLVAWGITNRIVLKFYSLHIINENYRNPIFLFISGMGFITLMGQIFITFRVNLFDLCPLYKILVTPKLCFLKKEILQVLGDKCLGSYILGLLFHTILISMLASKDLTQFVNDFHIFGFLLDFYSNIVFIFMIVGLSHQDLYVRTAFGHWLLALRSHLEHRFTHLHKYQRNKLRIMRAQNINSNSEQQLINLINSDEEAINKSFRDEYEAGLDGNGNRKNFPRLITFDMIQRNLNNMDDHLEVLRSVQISSMVLLSLNAFLVNGSLFLVSYHLLADQNNFYHGFLFLLLSLECLVVVFLCYSGDRWVYYALSSFVQTVEDEYFMQSDIKNQPETQQDKRFNIGTSDNTYNEIEGIRRNSSIKSQQQVNNINCPEILKSGVSPMELELDASKTVQSCRIYKAQQMLFIRKKDVLFCREFLHQFENHLATPWSKLTFITHLHMARAFVTLIAAQIIFDHEH